jgi:hypothetical protein
LNRDRLNNALGVLEDLSKDLDDMSRNEIVFTVNKAIDILEDIWADSEDE